MILNIILGILVCVGLIYLMEKYIPLKFNPTISVFLWVVILFLGYSLYKSIIGPVEFNKVKQVRYAKVIENLKDIRISELAHQEIEGKFSGNFDSLVQFLDTAKFAIIQRRDTSYADVEKNRAFGLDAQKGGYYKEEIIVEEKEDPKKEVLVTETRKIVVQKGPQDLSDTDPGVKNLMITASLEPDKKKKGTTIQI